MKLFNRKTLIFGLVILLVVVSLQVARRTPSLHTEDAVRDAVDIYIYGYPLVTFDMLTHIKVEMANHHQQRQGGSCGGKEQVIAACQIVMTLLVSLKHSIPMFDNPGS